MEASQEQGAAQTPVPVGTTDAQDVHPVFHAPNAGDVLFVDVAKTETGYLLSRHRQQVQFGAKAGQVGPMEPLLQRRRDEVPVVAVSPVGPNYRGEGLVENG